MSFDLTRYYFISKEKRGFLCEFSKILLNKSLILGGVRPPGPPWFPRPCAYYTLLCTLYNGEVFENACSLKVQFDLRQKPMQNFKVLIKVLGHIIHLYIGMYYIRCRFFVGDLLLSII